jgi:hypothetical protein
VDQVEERHAEAAVTLDVADDEPEVAFDETAERILIVLVELNAPAEIAFLIRRETRNLRDGAQVGL